MGVLVRMPAEIKLHAGVPPSEQVLHYKYLKEFRVDQCPLFLQHKCQQHRPFTCFNWHFQNQILGLGGALDDMSINDLYEGSKSRKSSGFSETQSKSRNCSGMEDSKSRNCSGNSISQGLVSSGFLSSSNPVNIPGSGELTDGFGLLSNMGGGEHHGDGGGYMTGLGGSNLGFSSGLFDFGPAHAAQATSNVKDVEICRLREELGAARAKLHSWEESMGQQGQPAMLGRRRQQSPTRKPRWPSRSARWPSTRLCSCRKSWSSSLVVHSCMHFVASRISPTCPQQCSRPLTGP